MTKRLVVIGGGIAGLSTAYNAHDLCAEGPSSCEVILLEAESELGGKVRTKLHGGHPLEAGPNAIMSPGPALESLVHRSGVELLHADQASKRRFLCRSGELHELDSNPVALLKSGLLPLGAKIRALAEPTIGVRRSEHGNHASGGWGDESVEAFLARRFGEKTASLFAAPFVSGIFAGDPRKLSLSACFPRLAAMEREHGSILKGMNALRRSGVKIPTLQSPRGGMQSLTRALGERAPFKTQVDVSVEAIGVNDGRWSLALSTGEQLEADALAVATSASQAAVLLSEHCQAAAASLLKISSPHLAVVSLIYSEAQAPRAPSSFGALFAHDGRSNLLGVLHESHIFPTRSDDGTLNLRVMMGGATRPELAESSDSQLLELASEELAAIYGFDEQPTHAHVTRWQESIPQYHLGHERLIADLSSSLDGMEGPPLALAGNYMSGVSLSDVAASGASCAASLCDQLHA